MPQPRLGTMGNGSRITEWRETGAGRIRRPRGSVRDDLSALVRTLLRGSGLVPPLALARVFARAVVARTGARSVTLPGIRAGAIHGLRLALALVRDQCRAGDEQTRDRGRDQRALQWTLHTSILLCSMATGASPAVVSVDLDAGIHSSIRTAFQHGEGSRGSRR